MDILMDIFSLEPSGLVIKKCFSLCKRLSVVVSVVSLLKDLKHANIVTLHDIVHTDKSLTLVFEYLVRLTVSHVLNA